METQNNGISEDTKSIITVLLLVFMYPVGLILMLFWVKWPWWVKLLVALPVSLIFLAILGIMGVAMLATVNPSEQINKAKDANLRMDATALYNAIELYYGEKGTMPWGKASVKYASEDVSKEVWMEKLSQGNFVKPSFGEQLKTAGKLNLIKEAGVTGKMAVCFAPTAKGVGGTACVGGL